jgi:hypothetical protein
MKQILVLFFAFTLMTNLSHGQLIDRFGVNIGSSYSTQIWDYKLISVDSDNEYKFGLQTFLQAEKDFGKLLTLRTEFGYVQKGFKSYISLISADLTEVETIKGNIILHDLALNLGIKLKPFKSNYSPYFFAGLRADYMISYRGIEFEELNSGLKFNLYESLIEDFNKFNFGGLIGLGINIKDLIYFEIEYNPNLTKNLNEPGLSIRDNCWGAKIGLNINKLSK